MKIDCVGVGICPLDHLALLKAYPDSDDKVQAVGWEIQGGGPSATAMATLSRLGRTTALVAGIGDDHAGKRTREELGKAGISTSALRLLPGEPHPIAHIWIDRRNGKRTVVLTRKLPNIERLNPKQERIIRNARFVLVDGTEPEAGLAAVRIAKNNGIPTMLDAGSIREATLELLKLCDIVIGEVFEFGRIQF